MKEFETTTGAMLKVGVASFEDCLALKNIVEKELSKQKIDINKIDLKSTDISAIISPILAVDSSQDFINAFFKVAKKSLYNDEKITRSTFEDESAREDYYFILFEVCKAALLPFFKGLASSFKHIIPKTATKNIQK